ncbi:hypothetical protein NE237_002419 [Protea cynaroides]|uniref:Uncharacterized protein n=1 Tax=Protea cynaroides TaxID=273540 RepID=A0A9Q0KV05_9MAGN|nr:hypothetical protein NE237_002419 [Protea cynaroides]
MAYTLSPLPTTRSARSICYKEAVIVVLFMHPSGRSMGEETRIRFEICQPSGYRDCDCKPEVEDRTDMLYRIGQAYQAGTRRFGWHCCDLLSIHSSNIYSSQYAGSAWDELKHIREAVDFLAAALVGQEGQCGHRLCSKEHDYGKHIWVLCIPLCLD